MGRYTNSREWLKRLDTVHWLTDFADFGDSVIGILGNFSYTEEQMISEILKEIEKHPEVNKEFDKILGNFS